MTGLVSGIDKITTFLYFIAKYTIKNVIVLVFFAEE